MTFTCPSLQDPFLKAWRTITKIKKNKKNFFFNVIPNIADDYLDRTSVVFMCAKSALNLACIGSG